MPVKRPDRPDAARDHCASRVHRQAPAPTDTLYNTCRKPCAAQRPADTRTEAGDDTRTDVGAAARGASPVSAPGLQRGVISEGAMMDNRANSERCIGPHRATTGNPSPGEGQSAMTPTERQRATMPNEPHRHGCSSPAKHGATRRTPRSVQPTPERPRLAGVSYTMRTK